MEGMNTENKYLIFNGKTYNDNYEFILEYYNLNNGRDEGTEQVLMELLQT